LGRTRDDYLLANLREILRIGSGTQVGPCRDENVGRSTIISGEGNRNHGAIGSPFLREIFDVKALIVIDCDHQR